MEAELDTCIPAPAMFLCGNWLDEPCTMCTATLVPALPTWFGLGISTEYDMSDDELVRSRRAHDMNALLRCHESFADVVIDEHRGALTWTE